MADLARLVDYLSTLTVIEAAQLSKLLEEKWGVSAAAPVAVVVRQRRSQQVSRHSRLARTAAAQSAVQRRAQVSSD